MIWWLAFEKKPFQFWREIWIQVVVILLQLYILSCNFALYIFSHFSQMHIFSKAIIYKSRGELSLVVQHKILLTFGPAQSCNYFKKKLMKQYILFTYIKRHFCQHNVHIRKSTRSSLTQNCPASKTSPNLKFCLIICNNSPRDLHIYSDLFT